MEPSFTSGRCSGNGYVEVGKRRIRFASRRHFKSLRITPVFEVRERSWLGGDEGLKSLLRCFGESDILSIVDSCALLCSDLAFRLFADRAICMAFDRVPQVRDLRVREKLELVEEIWRDVAQELDDMKVSEEEKEWLDSRWASFVASPSSALTTEDFMSRLDERRE